MNDKKNEKKLTNVYNTQKYELNSYNKNFFLEIDDLKEKESELNANVETLVIEKISQSEKIQLLSQQLSEGID